MCPTTVNGMLLGRLKMGHQRLSTNRWQSACWAAPGPVRVAVAEMNSWFINHSGRRVQVMWHARGRIIGDYPMTKSFRLSLVAITLASAGLLAVESASAAKFCPGGHLLPARCSKPANQLDAVCRCNTTAAERGALPQSSADPGTTYDDGDLQEIDVRDQ